jgi:hypothetical protein
MQTTLSGAQITELTKALTELPLGRLATASKTVQRFQRFLAQHIGEDRAAAAAPAILQSADPEAARRRLASALAPLSPSPAETDDGDGHGPTSQPGAAVNAAFRPATAKGRARFATLEVAAKAGQLPAPPDFSAPTHARFRARLGHIVALAEAGDIAGLRAIVINPVSSSPKAMARYRDLCVIALEARAS